VLSTFSQIRKGNAKLALKVCTMLLADGHDLMHKACGWMLREVGKRCSQKELTTFLDAHAVEMPRTMLRYAIERLSEGERKHYLAQKPKAY
jgi:3-methyladenine DNA glycosylase AlkD